MLASLLMLAFLNALKIIGHQVQVVKFSLSGCGFWIASSKVLSNVFGLSLEFHSDKLVLIIVHNLFGHEIEMHVRNLL